MPGTVLSLCDFSGNMVKPWAEAGWDAVCVDTRHSIRKDRETPYGLGRIRYIWGDVRSFTLDWRPDIVFAFPPCTHLASSGAQDWQTKGLRALIDALELVECCRWLAENSGAPWMLENPVGRLATLWRPADFLCDPRDFGDPWTKRTCLWVGGGFQVPRKSPVPATQGSLAARLGPSHDRQEERSETPMGFARAVFAANEALVRQRSQNAR